MRQETTHWGIEIVRAELKEIDPPPDVQATMNEVVKAEHEKVAAIDFATAEGEAQAIQLVNQAADKVFVGNAQLLRRLIAVETALSKNSKIVVPANGPCPCRMCRRPWSLITNLGGPFCKGTF